MDRTRSEDIDSRGRITRDSALPEKKTLPTKSVVTWFDRWISPERFFESKLIDVLIPLGPALGFVAFLLSLFYVPTEQVMGDVQRIFYFHVASAMTCYAMVGVAFFSGTLSLVTRQRVWGVLLEASLGVALLFAGVVLLTGMIWGHSAWNTWWRWEPRLVSFLVLWLILLGAVILGRMLSRSSHREKLLAVSGIVAAVNIPIVVFSVNLLERTEQLHPQVLANQGLRDPRFVYALLFSIIALLFFGASLLFVRVGQLLLERMTDDLFIQKSQIRSEMRPQPEPNVKS